MKSLKNTNNLVIFDLDGVLIDSMPNMKKSWKEVAKRLDLKQSFEEYIKYLGLPFEEILKKIGIKEKKLIKKIKKIYEANSIKNIKKIKFYSGFKYILKYLKKKDYRLSIITSKNKKRTELILGEFKNFFDTINTPELKIKGKPHPDQIFYAIRKSNSSIKRTFFIGDSIFDKLAAKSAGVKFIYADYGYGNLNQKVSLNKLVKLKEFVR